MTPFKLARLSLSRHLFATVIVVIAIGLSVACGGMLLRLYKLSDSRFSAMGRGGDALVGAKAGGIEIMLGSLNGEGPYPDFLPYKLFESLKSEQTVKFEDGASSKPSYIESVIPFVYFAKFDETFRVVGTDESFYKRSRNGESLSLSQGQWFSEQGEVVLGSSVAEKSDLKVGDSIKVHPWIGNETLSNEISLRVSGILLSTGTQWDRTVFSSVTQAHQVFEQNQSALLGKSIWGSNVLNYFLVYLKPNGFSALEALVNKRTVAQAVEVETQKTRLEEISGAGRNVGIFITAFVLLLGGLSVCSMLVTRFEGMSLQLAVLSALGYTKKELSQWLLWEGFLLGLMGVVFGAVIDMAGFPVLRSLLGSSLPPADLVSSSIFNSAIIWVVALVAIVASVSIPMFRMSRQDTHNSLKGI